MRYTIKLFCAADGWMTLWDDPRVYELFGTDIIPTPYTADCQETHVLEAIRARNPEYDVSVLYTVEAR